MKRKDAGEVNHDFFDFTLSSPALKIRRLDAELAPIINEQHMSNPVEFGQPKPLHDNIVEQPMESIPILTDELRSSVPVNEGRAIVLFNPNHNSHSFESTIPFSISTCSDFLSRFKNPVIWSNRSDTYKLLADETQELDEDSGVTNECLAVVPWVAGHSQHPQTAEFAVREAQLSDMMDSDDMDVETNCNTREIQEQHNNNHYVAASATQDWNPWQQHCMIQQPPNNFSTPITWLG